MSNIKQKPPPCNPQTLVQISAKIKALEKKSITNVVAIGKLLQEADEQCKHGEYLKWLKTEFAWSHQTSLRYREVYRLTQNPHNVDFEKLNISLTALYEVSDYVFSEACGKAGHLVAGMAVIEAARHHRVSCAEAKEIIDKTLNPDDGKDDDAGDDKEKAKGKQAKAAKKKKDPADDKDDGPEDDHGNDDDAEAQLTRDIRGVLFYAYRPLAPAWSGAIENVGAEHIQVIIDALTTQLDQYEQAKGIIETDDASREKMVREKLH